MIISTMNANNAAGFTIIEMVVSLAIVALFLLFFIQLFLTTESQRISTLRRTTASDIAYSNLRKFASRPALACNTDMDLSATANAPGTIISTPTYSFTAETTPGVLGTGVTQVVRAYAPSGCTAYNANPVKIISEVTYGTNEKIIHAAFVD